jgi:hypothetical protein
MNRVEEGQMTLKEENARIPILFRKFEPKNRYKRKSSATVWKKGEDFVKPLKRK